MTLDLLLLFSSTFGKTRPLLGNLTVKCIEGRVNARRKSIKVRNALRCDNGSTVHRAGDHLHLSDELGPVQEKMAKRLMFLYTVALLVAFEVISAQRTFRHLACNRQLATNDFRPGTFALWSDVFDSVKDGDTVTIPCGRAIKVDVEEIPKLGGLFVEGLLYFPHDDNMRKVIRTDSVLVTGYLWVGRSNGGMTGNTSVTFELTSGKDLTVDTSELNPDSLNGPPVSVMEFGKRAFTVLGGQVEFGGLSSGCHHLTWGLLKMTAKAGSSSITLDRNLHGCWRVGQRIGIAPSKYDYKEAETRIITSISGTSLTLDEPLEFIHFGANENRIVESKLMDYAAEVILLSRPIVVRSDSEDIFEGGHFIMAHSSPNQLVQGVEFIHMGQLGQKGRYPIHVHFCGENKEVRIKGCAIHQSNQRGVVIHASMLGKVRDNVLFHVHGHAIMVAEDHFSTKNDIQRNVIIDVRHNGRRFGLPGDDLASGIWIGNPRNRITDNRVGGSARSGIWYEMTTAITGDALELPGAKDVNPRELEIQKFSKNLVHSCSDHGVRFYPGRWLPKEPNLASKVTSYRNNGFGLLMHAHLGSLLTDSIFFDNKLGGVDFDRSRNLTISNSVVIGTTGKEDTQCPVKAGVEIPPFNFPEFMSGIMIDNVAFDGFASCDTKPIGIDTQDEITNNGWVSTANFVKNCRFLDNSPPISMQMAEIGENDWDQNLAIRFQNTLDFTDGFLVTERDFMAPAQKRCTRRWGGLACDNICYRSVLLMFQTEPNIENYAFEITRISDGEKFRKGAQISTKYYFNLEAGQAYEVRMFRRPGSRLPDAPLTIDMADHDFACYEGLELRFIELDYSVSPFERFAAVPVQTVDGCGEAGPVDEPTTYKRCEKGLTQTVLKVNPGPQPKAAPRGMRVRFEEGGSRPCERSYCQK